MKQTFSALTFLVAILWPYMSFPADDDGARVRVNCAKSTGEMKGLHRHYSGGFAAFTEPGPLKPYLDQIGANAYRLPIFRSPEKFKGKTIEDARNPDMYDFSEVDELAGKVDALGLDLFATFAHVPPQLSEDGTVKGPATGENLKVFAEVLRHVVLHLTQGWANGFKYRVPYLEIWNEPDLADVPAVRGAYFTGTQQQLFELYAEVSRTLKSIEPLSGQPPFKVGGPAFTGFKRNWHEPFLAYCDANELPLDFFSFHHYDSDPQGFARIAEEASNFVRKYPRYAKTELIIDEWNLAPRPWGAGREGKKDMDVVWHVICNPGFLAPWGATHMARSLLVMERSPIAMAHHFLMVDNGVSTMGVVTCPDVPMPPRSSDAPGPDFAECTPRLKFYAAKAFKTLYETPHLVDLSIRGEALDGMAGISKDKKKATLLLVNWGESKRIQLNVTGLSWENNQEFSWTVRAVNQSLYEDNAAFSIVDEHNGKGASLDTLLDAPTDTVIVVELIAK